MTETLATVTTKAAWLAAGERARRRLQLGPFDVLTPSQVTDADLRTAEDEELPTEPPAEEARGGSRPGTPLRRAEVVVVRATAPDSGPDPLAYDLPAAAAAVRLSETHLRRELHARRLRGRMVGRKYRISRVDLQAWFDSLPEA